MAIQKRRPMNNSTRGALEAARQDDLSASDLPKPPGYDGLNEYGRGTFETLYRSDPSRWTEADLLLLVSVAQISQQLAETERELVTTPRTVTHKSGSPGTHPLHQHYAVLTKTRAALLRDLGIRGRDAGSKSRPTSGTSTFAPGGKTFGLHSIPALKKNSK